MNKDYMSDNFQIQGTDPARMLEAAEELDKNTYVKLCSFSEGEILHYIGSNATDLFFAVAAPEEPTRIIRKDARIMVAPPKTKVFNMAAFLRYGCFSIVEDMMGGKNRTVFDLRRDLKDGPNSLLFVSSTAKKTMLPRLTKCNITDDVLERDVLLAKLIGESIDPVERYVVYRQKQSIRRMFGMFTRMERVSFKEAAQAAINYRGGGICQYWEITNQYGLEAVFSYEDLSKKAKEEIPGLNIIPVIAVSACDSGYATNHVSTGWLFTGAPEANAVFTHDIALPAGTGCVIDAYRKAMEEAETLLLNDLERLKSKKQVHTPDDPQSFEKKISEIARTMTTDVGAGLKARNVITARLSEDCRPGMDECEIFEAAVSIAGSESYLKTSPYAGKVTARKGFLSFFG